MPRFASLGTWKTLARSHPELVDGRGRAARPRRSTGSPRGLL